MADGSPAEPSASGMEGQGTRAGLKVALELHSILEHCKCSICMGIIKNTRAVSACMHRFCKDCIEAWLRTQIENNCPQCRVKFSSKRDCKPDPNFDLLLGAMFGDITEFEQQMLDPSLEVLERAKAIGHQIAMAKEQAAVRRTSPPPLAYPQHHGHHDQQLQQAAQLPGLPTADGTVHVTVAQPSIKVQPAPPLATTVLVSNRLAAAVAARQLAAAALGSKRQPPNGPGSDAKRQKLSNSCNEEEGGLLQYRGVRFQGDNWQARTKRAGKELSLGLYNTAEEAGMAYDLDRLQQQGGKAQRLNFPLLRQHYKQILADLADLHTPDGLLDFLAVAVQAAVKAARNIPGATAPENTGPAAASMLNPRRGIAPAVHAHAVITSQQRQPIGQSQAGGAAALAPAVAAAGTDSEPEAAYPEEPDTEPEPEPEQLASPSEQQIAARQRAEQLAAAYPLAAGLADGLAHVRLEAGSGLAWRMAYLACPASATIAQLAEVVVLGLSQQHGLRPGQVQVGLAVANDLDASADFDALCYEDSFTGNLLVRGHITIRELLDTLQDASEDLALEYFSAAGPAAAEAAMAPAAPAAVLAAYA